MSERTNSAVGLPGAEVFGPARVLEVDAETGRVQVMLAATDDAPSPRSVWADRAMPFDSEIGWGDQVLVAGRDTEDVYVVGVLGARKAAAEAPRELRLESGVRAEIEGHRLSVHSSTGRLLFQYDESTGRSRVDLPEGDVEFVARSGNIDFISAGKVRFASREEIELSSLEGVRIATREVSVKAKKGRLAIEEASYEGRRLRATLDAIKTVARRSESMIETVIERAKNSYHSVEELSQLTAGRVRALVDGVYQVQSKEAFLRSKKDFKIDGEQIHLG